MNCGSLVASARMTASTSDEGSLWVSVREIVMAAGSPVAEAGWARHAASFGRAFLAGQFRGAFVGQVFAHHRP